MRVSQPTIIGSFAIYPRKKILMYMMNKITASISAAILLGVSGGAVAAGDYNDVPAGDKQYSQCVDWSSKRYDGGNDKSPIKGQTKVQAFCECMWNETPDNFRGNLVKYAESAGGKKTNATCEKYSKWTE